MISFGIDRRYWKAPQLKWVDKENIILSTLSILKRILLEIELPPREEAKRSTCTLLQAVRVRSDYSHN